MPGTVNNKINCFLSMKDSQKEQVYVAFYCILYSCSIKPVNIKPKLCAQLIKNRFTTLRPVDIRRINRYDERDHDDELW